MNLLAFSGLLVGMTLVGFGFSLASHFVSHH